MRLHWKILLLVNVLLLGAVVATTVPVLRGTRRSILRQMERDGIALAKLLARTAQFALKIPAKIDAALGDQMVVEARLSAHLVAVAEGRAGMKRAEIIDILKDVTEKTVLNEFWITDETGWAYLTNTDYYEFRFIDDAKVQPQAHVFYKLLREKDGVVIQESRKREIDDRIFKYVGVSGIDKPRVVQVGYESTFLREVSKDVDIQHLAEELTSMTDIAAIRIHDRSGALLASAVNAERYPSSVLAGGSEHREIKEDQLRSDFASRQPRTQNLGEVLEVGVPLLKNDKTIEGAVFVELPTAGAHKAIAQAIKGIVAVACAVLAMGVVLSVLVARKITSPISELTKGVRTIGKGELDHRVEVRTGDELEELGNAFNKMAGDLVTYTHKLERATAERERIQRELEIASEIQKNFLPSEFPEISGMDVAALSIPARHVGGDFYDFIPLSEGKWGIVIADVSGKGIPAALFMAVSRSLVRSYTMHSKTALEGLRHANEYITLDSRAGMFVTLFYAILDVQNRTLSYLNAGHNPPLMVTRDSTEALLLETGGIPLGIQAEIGLEEKVIELDKVDSVIMYTDGITEAINTREEQFGVEALRSVVKSNLGKPAGGVIANIRKSLMDFTKDMPQFDDFTLVVIRPRR